MILENQHKYHFYQNILIKKNFKKLENLVVVIFQKKINIKKDSLTELFLIFYVRNEHYKKVILQAI